MATRTTARTRGAPPETPAVSAPVVSDRGGSPSVKVARSTDASPGARSISGGLAANTKEAKRCAKTNARDTPGEGRRARRKPRGGGERRETRGKDDIAAAGRGNTTIRPTGTRARARARRVDGRGDHDPRAKTSSFKSDGSTPGAHRGSLVGRCQLSFSSFVIRSGLFRRGAQPRSATETLYATAPRTHLFVDESYSPAAHRVARSSSPPISRRPPRAASPLEDHLLGHLG